MRFTLISLLLILSKNIYCQSDRHNELGEFENPKGMVMLNQNVFIDESEMSNLNWMEFLHFIKKDSSNAFYESMLPDSTILWSIPAGSLIFFPEIDEVMNSEDFNKAFLEQEAFYKMLAYKSFPIVGIDYNRASQYCEWREQLYKDKFSENYPGNQYNIDFRLPNTDEFSMARDSAIDLVRIPKNVKKVLKNQGINDFPKRVYNSTINQDLSSKNRIYVSGINYIGEIKFGEPNSKGIYGLSGNLTEYSIDKDITLGASFLDDPKDMGNIEFEAGKVSNNYIGFRCICEITKL